MEFNPSSLAGKEINEYQFFAREGKKAKDIALLQKATWGNFILMMVKKKQRISILKTIS